MYVAQNIDYQLKGKPILQSVNLRLKAGTFTALLGPNGAGKSSLLKIISGRVKPQKGIVLLEEQDIQDYKESELALRRAVLPQKSNIQFPYSVKEVVMMGCFAHQQTQAKQEKLALEKLDEVNFQYPSNRIYQNLSGGEQQRVQLARVLAQISAPTNTEKYLLLDEPTASLDIAREQQFMQTVKKLCKAGIGVLAVIHDINLAIQYADELVFMKSGRVIQSGATDQIINQKLIEKVYDHAVQLLQTDQRSKPFIMPISTPIAPLQKQIMMS